jgi:hypothetical protein
MRLNQPMHRFFISSTIRHTSLQGFKPPEPPFLNQTGGSRQQSFESFESNVMVLPKRILAASRMY